MKIWLFALMMGFGFTVQAQDLGIIVGIRGDSADSETTGVTVTGKSGFQVGAVGKFDLRDAWQIRSGFIYSQRIYEVKAAPAAGQDWKFTYFEIPVNVLYKFSDYGGAFIGPAIALNVSKDCASSTCDGVNSAPISMQIGASFKFAPQMGAEVYYEMGLSKIATGVKNPKAVMANFMFTFD